MKTTLILLLMLCANSVFGQYYINLYADSVHAPFLYGVASGDPDPHEVTIWTKIKKEVMSPQEFVFWEISSDENFQNIVQSGFMVATPGTDYTTQVRVTGLNSYFQYHYRFHDGGGNYSVHGRTRTAPTGDQCDHFRFGVVSCSSLFSGYFNAYEGMANRLDLDAIIHLGDYIYDFVDSDEEVRIPSPYPQTPNTLDEWRDRHEMYLLDPQFRKARQNHAFITVWDNHDMDWGNPPFYQGGLQAFHEYVPMKVPDPNVPNKIWRKLSYGDVLDIFMVDILLHRDVDPVPNSSELSILGTEQYNWLSNELLNSTAKWKVIGQQKIVGGWSVIGLPSWFPLGNGQVLDENNWDGYDDSRDQLLNFIDLNYIDNCVFLTGDSHISLACDLSRDPYDGSVYVGSTGQGSVGVEFLPSSVSRGNFNELLDPVLHPLIGSLVGFVEGANPNHVYSEYVEHGYGILDIKPDLVTGEFWYNNILTVTNTETFGKGVVCDDGANHWRREFLLNPTGDKPLPDNIIQDTLDTSGLPDLSIVQTLEVFPNPNDGSFTVLNPLQLDLSLFNKSGQVIRTIAGKGEVEVAELTSGVYFIVANTPKGIISKKIVVR